MTNTLTTTQLLTRIEQLATLIEEQTKQRFIEEYGDLTPHMNSMVVNVKLGNKYTKIDRGSSGFLMIDADGNIFGIKAYGVIHRGHYYGTLDTINDYNWGDYTPVKVGA